MNTTQQTGDDGLDFITNNVDCPNCGKSLMRLSKNYPLFNLQCTCCSFRAHVKTSTMPPRAVLAGAGWDILNGVLKCGYMVPPLIVNYCWIQDSVKNREIRFFPFIPKINLKPRPLSPKHRHAGHKMFDYIGLDKLPYLEMAVHKRRLIFSKEA